MMRLLPTKQSEYQTTVSSLVWDTRTGNVADCVVDHHQSWGEILCNDTLGHFIFRWDQSL